MCNIITNLQRDHRSSALDMTESRLGRGWKSTRRRCWCAQGRMRAARARFTRSPSTVPIRTSELVIADRRMLSRIDGDGLCCCWWRLLMPLWRLQRKDPGCVLGEHMQVRRWEAWATGARSATARERPGEVGRRSRENRTDGVSGAEPTRWTRVGEAERCWWLKKVEERAAKLEDEDAKPEAAEEEQNRPDGEIERWNALEIGSTGPLLDLALLEVVAIEFVGGERK